MEWPPMHFSTHLECGVILVIIKYGCYLYMLCCTVCYIHVHEYLQEEHFHGKFTCVFLFKVVGLQLLIGHKVHVYVHVEM